MSFKSGSMNSGLQTSDGASKDLTAANVNDANQRAELDAQISRQQATENAKRKGELHKEAQEDEIPEGYARFVSANKHMSYVKKNGEIVRWYNGRLDTNDKDAIEELRAALKGGNNVFWEVRPQNVAAAPKQKETGTFNKSFGGEMATGSVETTDGMKPHESHVQTSSPGTTPVPLSKPETSVREVTSPTGKVEDTKEDKPITFQSAVTPKK